MRISELNGTRLKNALTAGAVILPLVLTVLNHIFGYSFSVWIFSISAGIAGFILFTHRENLIRLANGTENRFVN